MTEPQSPGQLPLAGRVALVTGASRRAGIGFAVARRLAADGAAVLLQGWSAGDAERPWGPDAEGAAGLAAEIAAGGARAEALEVDLGDAEGPAQAIDAAYERLGRLDIVVANHTHWHGEPLAELTAAQIDRHLEVVVRGSMLLASAWVRRRSGRPPGPADGRLMLFVSGQHRGPMPDELAYVAAKGALHQLTPSLAAAMAPSGVTVNAVNPGATDTGWISDAFRPELEARFPEGRVGRPEDVARLVAWLASDESRWVTGQVIDSEGGFRRG